MFRSRLDFKFLRRLERSKLRLVLGVTISMSALGTPAFAQQRPALKHSQESVEALDVMIRPNTTRIKQNGRLIWEIYW